MPNKPEHDLVKGITGVKLHPTIPMHMVNELGHTVPKDELPITPHHTSFNTPFASPILRGTSEEAVADEVNQKLTNYQLMNPHAVPILEAINTNPYLGLPIGFDEIGSTVSRPVSRNPANSPVSGLSDAGTADSFKSVSSWPMPHNPVNTPAIASPAMSDIEQPRAAAKYASSEISETPRTSEQSLAPSSQPAPQGPVPTLIGSPETGAIQDGSDIDSTILEPLPPKDVWQLSQQDHTEVSRSYQETATAELEQMLDAASTETVKEKLVELKKTLQKNRYDGDERLIRYDGLLAELNKVVSQAQLERLRKSWNMPVDEDLIDIGLPADEGLKTETRGTITLLHEQTVKRAQDLARAQRIVEEKLLLLNDKE